MQSPAKSARTLAVATLLGLLSSCTPLGAIKNFGAATKDVSTQTAACYTSFNSSLVDARRNTAILTKKPVTPAILTSPLASSFKLRVDMLNSLGAYAGALEALATKDANAEIEKSATSLAGELNKLSTTYEKSTSRSLGISASDASLIATGVKVAGNGYTEIKRKEAIRRIVISMDPVVQKVCSYLPGELRKTGYTLDGFLLEEVSTYTKVLNANINTLPPAQALQEGQKIQELSDRQKATLPLFEAAANAIGKVGETHAKLVVAVNTKDFTTSDFVSKLDELIKYANEVDAYHDSIKPSDKNP